MNLSEIHYVAGKARLEDRKSMLDEVKTVQPSRIICMAGLVGKPDVTMFDSNQVKTIRINLVGQLNLADVAYKCGQIHCTLLTTGGI